MYLWFILSFVSIFYGCYEFHYSTGYHYNEEGLNYSLNFIFGGGVSLVLAMVFSLGVEAGKEDKDGK